MTLMFWICVVHLRNIRDINRWKIIKYILIFIIFSSASFVKTNSLSEQPINEKSNHSFRSSFDNDTFGPLGNVRYAVGLYYKINNFVKWPVLVLIDKLCYDVIHFRSKMSLPWNHVVECMSRHVSSLEVGIKTDIIQPEIPDFRLLLFFNIFLPVFFYLWTLQYNIKTLQLVFRID